MLMAREKHEGGRRLEGTIAIGCSSAHSAVTSSKIPFILFITLSMVLSGSSSLRDIGTFWFPATNYHTNLLKPSAPNQCLPHSINNTPVYTCSSMYGYILCLTFAVPPLLLDLYFLHTHLLPATGFFYLYLCFDLFIIPEMMFYYGSISCRAKQSKQWLVSLSHVRKQLL
jgi:hypothetical protein